MKKFISILALVFIAASAFAEGTFRLTILYTNDLHGWFIPFDYSSSNQKFMAQEFVDASLAPRLDSGGLARRATLVARLRKESPSPIVLIDSGDLFNRGPYQAKSQGELEVRAYDAMGYDMVCVGNNDLKGKADAQSQGLLLKLMRESRFPWLCANLTVGDTGQPVEGLRPFIVRDYGGIKVGFLGLTSGRSGSYPQVKGWSVGDPIEAAKKWVPIARKECDILIAVTHIGFEEDRWLAMSVEGIDAIVGGDSHTFLQKPFDAKGAGGRTVPIVQDGAYGVCVGRLDLVFENSRGWVLASDSGELLPLGPDIADDPEVAKILAARE